MKILVLVILVAAAWLLAGYSFQHRNDNTVPVPATVQVQVEPTTTPERTRLPAPGAQVATLPPATLGQFTPAEPDIAPSGPPVLFRGKISQKTPEGDLLIVCEKNIPVKEGHHALENPWRGVLGSSEIEGEFLLMGDPEGAKLVDNDPIGGIAQLGGPYAFNTPQGGLRHVRKIIWVDPKTVSNYQPQDPAAAGKSKLHGIGARQKAAQVRR